MVCCRCAYFGFAIDQNAVNINKLPLMHSCHKRTAKQFKEGLYRKTPLPAKPSTGFRDLTPFAKLSGTSRHHDDRSSLLSQENITPNHHKQQWLGRCIEKVEYTFNSKLELPKKIQLSAAQSSLKTAYKQETNAQDYGFLEGTFVEHRGKIVRLQEKMRSIFDQEDELDNAMDEQEETDFTYPSKDDQDLENRVFDQQDVNLDIFTRTSSIFEPKSKAQRDQNPASPFYSSRKTINPIPTTDILGSSKLN